LVTWFTADQHFDHSNILGYCGRDFKNVQAMNNKIIRNYQELIQKDDTVYFLGDLSLRTSDHIRFYRKLLEQLPGQKHLILGNHDSLKPFTYVDLGFISVHTSLDIGKYILVHDPVPAFLYPNRIWLCGHVHNLFKTCRNVINVGVDVWDFKPVNEEQIDEVILCLKKD